MFAAVTVGWAIRCLGVGESKVRRFGPDFPGASTPAGKLLTLVCQQAGQNICSTWYTGTTSRTCGRSWMQARVPWSAQWFLPMDAFTDRRSSGGDATPHRGPLPASDGAQVAPSCLPVVFSASSCPIRSSVIMASL